MKRFLALLFVVLVFAGCNDKPVELITINASAYVDDEKVTGNFALISPTETYIFSDEGAVNRYFATIQQNSKVAVTDFSAKVLPGEYVLLIQLKEGSAGALFQTYTYNFITTRGAAARTNYVMQFQSGRSTYYQHWEDRK